MKVIDDMFGFSREFLPKRWVLSRNPNGTRVQVALSHHDATLNHEWRSCETELIGPE